MTTVLLATGLIGVAMAGLAAGVIFSNKELKGSCGGKGGEDCVCELEKRRACHAADVLQSRQALQG
jgi:hypothetical protein|tara:strand:+ start:83 stop:280 length:198 start_codon:yes stop_codon:yes gene_type:complete